MKPAVKPTATESKEQQILRAIAMKREAFFQLILGNLIQNPANGDKDIESLVEIAMRGADHAIKQLYKVDQGGE